LILAYLLGGGFLLGSRLLIGPALAARVLKTEHLRLGWLPYFRVGLLTAGGFPTS
jgi:hypothetical protein